MKCNCGYERNHDREKNMRIGDEDFMIVKFPIVYLDNEGWERVASICICPKCGNLQIYNK